MRVYCFQSSFLSVLILVQTVINRTPHSRRSKESVKRDKHWWLQNRGSGGGVYCFQSSFLSVLILVQTVISRTPHSRRSKESVKRDKQWWLQNRGSWGGGGGVYCFQSSFLSVLILVQTVISRTPHCRPSKESVKRDKQWWLQNRGCWGGECTVFSQAFCLS